MRFRSHCLQVAGLPPGKIKHTLSYQQNERGRSPSNGYHPRESLKQVLRAMMMVHLQQFPQQAPKAMMMVHHLQQLPKPARRAMMMVLRIPKNRSHSIKRLSINRLQLKLRKSFWGLSSESFLAPSLSQRRSISSACPD